jgi:hypothetical protein
MRPRRAVNEERMAEEDVAGAAGGPRARPLKRPRREALGDVAEEDTAIAEGRQDRRHVEM